MTITTQRIKNGKQYKVSVRQGHYTSTAYSTSKKQAFQNAISGAWHLLHEIA